MCEGRVPGNKGEKKCSRKDDKSKKILLQMLDDEARHATVALEAGGYEFPLPVRFAMTGLSKVMTKSVYKI